MAQDITIAGASFSDVPAIVVPKTGSGTATFLDTTISSSAASAGDIASGKLAYVNGSLITGTGSGGGGGLTLLSTTDLGALSTTASTATDSGKSLTLASSTNWDDYDVLVIDVRRTYTESSRHIATVSMIYVTGQINIYTKNTYAVGSNKWNEKMTSSGIVNSRQNSTSYGIYAYSVTVSDGVMTIPLYYRKDTNNSGNINGDYVAKIYGMKLYGGVGT